MSNFGDSDLPTFFSDFAKPIVYGGVTAQGLVDAYDKDESGMVVRVQDRVTMVTVPYNAFSTPLVKEASVTVDSVAMKIRDIEQKNDGGITQFSAVFP